MRRQLGPRPGEQLDIADDLDAGVARALRDRVAVERQAGGDDDGVELGEVGVVEVGDPALELPERSLTRSVLRRAWPSSFARFLLVVPRRHPRPARQQRLDRRQAAPRKTKDSIMFSGEGLGGDHLSLSVDRPARARMKLMIQKRITTVGSLQPRCSK